MVPFEAPSDVPRHPSRADQTVPRALAAPWWPRYLPLPATWTWRSIARLARAFLQGAGPEPRARIWGYSWGERCSTVKTPPDAVSVVRSTPDWRASMTIRTAPLRASTVTRFGTRTR